MNQNIFRKASFHKGNLSQSHMCVPAIDQTAFSDSYPWNWPDADVTQYTYTL